MKNKVNCASIGVNLPEDIARDIDAMFQTLPLECKSYHRKAMVVDKIDFEPGERSEISVITTNCVDKSDEVVLPTAVNFDTYRRNPVVLWNHNQELPPVAHCKWIKEYNDSIRAKSVYPERTNPDPDRPWFIDEIWDLVRGGILRAKSIGFLPQTPKREATTAELTDHPDWANAGVWDDVLLVEYSCCSIGVNNEALVQAVNTKSFDPAKLLEIGIAITAPETKTLTFIEKASQTPEAQTMAHNFIEKGHSPEQAMLMAVAVLNAKPMRKKAVRKAPSQDELMSKAIDAIKISPEQIVRHALELIRNRTRV